MLYYNRTELERRKEEAEEFFQEQEEQSNSYIKESDDSDYETGKLPVGITETEPNELYKNAGTTSKNISEILENINETVSNGSENQNTEISENHKEINMIELHAIRTELDDELDAMPTTSEPKNLKLPVTTDFIPKLEGDKGLIIDFETNDLKPMPKTGVEELLTRFVTNALVKPHVPEFQDVR